MKILPHVANPGSVLPILSIRLPDGRSMGVIVATVVLFIVALFLKGFSQAILVEAGVFLVSVKLILMAARLEALEESTLEKLERIEESIGALKRTVDTKGGGGGL